MWFTRHPLVRISYFVPVGLTACVSAWFGLPWWSLAALAGMVLVAWDWLWGFDVLMKASTPWLMVIAGGLGLAVGFVLAHRLGLGLDEFVELRANAPRRATWLYWLPGYGLALVVYGIVLRCMQMWRSH